MPKKNNAIQLNHFIPKSKRDWGYSLQLIMLFLYAFIARIYFYFERSNITVIILVVLGISADLFLKKITYGLQFSIKQYRPTAAVITALSCSLLIDSILLLPYIFACSLAIASKYLFTIHGKHYFNPANFGVSLVLLWQTKSTSLAMNIFSSSLLMPVIFLIAGLVISFLANQLRLSLIWMGCFLFFATILSKLSFELFIENVLIMLSSSFLLFSFNMITDPATTPKSLKTIFIFCFSVATIDALFRINFVPNGLFYSLLIISSIMPIASYIALKFKKTYAN